MEEVISTEEVAQEETVDEQGEETQQEETTEEVISAPEVEEIKLPPPKKKTAEERIAELTWKRREAERKAEELQRKLDERVPENKPTGERPRLENFETIESYEDALLAWHETRRDKERNAERQRADEMQALEKYNERAAKLREVYHDFDEVVERPVFSPTMRDVLLRSDEGALVSYWLASPDNQATADRIRSLSPELQIYELGKLENKLTNAQRVQKTSQAPPPVKPVGITGGTSVDESQLSDEEWFRLDQKRRLEKLQKKHGG